MGLARSLGKKVAVRNYKGDVYLRFGGSDEFKAYEDPVLAVFKEALQGVQISMPVEEEPKPSGFSLFGRRENNVEEEEDGSEIREEIE